MDSPQLWHHPREGGDPGPPVPQSVAPGFRLPAFAGTSFAGLRRAEAASAAQAGMTTEGVDTLERPPL
jgi:hypothetical protein